MRHKNGQGINLNEKVKVDKIKKNLREINSDHGSCIPVAQRYPVACVNTTSVGTLIVATNYLQLIQNRYMFPSFTVLQCSHQHCVQPVSSDVEVVGYL